MTRITSFLPRSRDLAARVLQPFQAFLEREAASAVLLVSGAFVAMVWANSPWGHSYHTFWHTPVSFTFGDRVLTKPFLDWIDEGLMSIFFFTVGLEIKREILVGELASVKKALLPVTAALGGMVLPAAIFGALNAGTEEIVGWGIPMATDIAFALGAVALLGNRVPLSLRVFLSAFAIADDLGAVVVIAVFYTKELVMEYLVLSGCIVLGLAFLNGLWIRRTLPYALLGIALWLCILGSGLHATVAGVVVAIFIPARGRYDTDRFLNNISQDLQDFQCPPDGCGQSIMLNAQHLHAVHSMEISCHDVETPLQRLEHALHPWVAFGVIPLFALANGGVTLANVDIASVLTSRLTLGISLGLVLGKPAGILVFSWLAVRLGLAALPDQVSWPQIFGAGVLGGMGFTMSLFIAGLSFSQTMELDVAKIGILMGSVVAGVCGLIFLYSLSRNGRPSSPGS